MPGTMIMVAGLAAALAATGTMAQQPGGMAPPIINMGNAIRLTQGDTQGGDENLECSSAIAASASGRVLVHILDGEGFPTPPAGYYFNMRFGYSTNSAQSFPTAHDGRFRGALVPPNTTSGDWLPGSHRDTFATADPATGRLWFGGIAERGGAVFDRAPGGVFVSRVAATGSFAPTTPLFVARNDLMPPVCGVWPCPTRPSYWTPNAAFGHTILSDTADRALYVAFVQQDVYTMLWNVPPEPRQYDIASRILVARSLDGGVTFDSPVSTGASIPHAPPTILQDRLWAPTPLVLANGRVVVVYSTAIYRGKVWCVYSDDEGQTWSTPVTVADDPQWNMFYKVPGMLAYGNRIASLTASAAKSTFVRANGMNDVYAAYPDLVLDGLGQPTQIRFVIRRSVDGGATWGTPYYVPLGPDETGFENNFSDQFGMEIATDSLGGVNVLWWQSNHPDRTLDPVPYGLHYGRINDFGTVTQSFHRHPEVLETVISGDANLNLPFGFGEWNHMAGVGQRVYLTYPGPALSVGGPIPLKVKIRRVDLELP